MHDSTDGLTTDETDGVTTNLPTSDHVQVRLQVGERLFTTTRLTLIKESTYFASLLSGRWDNTQEDGTYFVDADPALFEHILRYLRRSVYPVFYDEVRGHNYGLYIALSGEAIYFGICRLQQWLEQRRYLDAVKFTRTVEGVHDGYSILSAYQNVPTDTTLEFHTSWFSKKVYICPRGIDVHRGSPGACGRQCKNAQGDNPDMFEDEPCLRLLVTRKQVIVRPEVCMASDG